MELLQTLADDAELARQLAPVGSPLATPAHSFLRRHTPPTSPQRLPSGHEAEAAALSPAASREVQLQVPGQAAAPQQRSTIEIVVSAVGLGLQFVHLDPVGQRPPSRPGSGMGSQQASVAADLARTAAQQAQSQPALAMGPAQQKGATAGRAVQLLAAYLDLAASYKIEVGGRRLQRMGRGDADARCRACCSPVLETAPVVFSVWRRARCRLGTWRCRACGSRRASSQASRLAF